MSWCVVCIWFSAGQTRSYRAPSWAQQGHESLWKLHASRTPRGHESTCLQSQPVNEAAHPSPARVIFPEIIRNRLFHSHVARCWHLLHFSWETATNKTIPIKLNWLRMGFHKRTELIQQLAAARQGWSLLPPSQQSHLSPCALLNSLKQHSTVQASFRCFHFPLVQESDLVMDGGDLQSQRRVKRSTKGGETTATQLVLLPGGFCPLCSALISKYSSQLTGLETAGRDRTEHIISGQKLFQLLMGWNSNFHQLIVF